MMMFTDKFDKEDYYFSEEGYLVFTEAYHLKRGYCCHNSCRHCPYREIKEKKPAGKQQD
jgi:Family of unknown function (DUF5522)